MTAIAGISGRKQQGSEAVETILERTGHRGRGESRIVAFGSATLGARASRLSAARGDGLAREQDAVLVFDGELFNPEADGMADAEFALQMFRRHGRGFARHLDGVFACAVFDGRDLLLVRDGLGVRPLYYGRNQRGELAFSSEMKGLVGVREEIEELLPGTLCSQQAGVAAWLREYPPIHIGDDFPAVRKQVRETMTEAVEKRLADGAVGACLLSGGLDSTIIAAIVRELGVVMPLLTVGVEGASDIENAKLAAAELGMPHHIRVFDRRQIADQVPYAVAALGSFDEDCVSGAISNLFAADFARRWTDCILSGEGGDELFGGYHLLKDLNGEGTQLRMMDKLVAIAYNTALQRLDRSMMANSIHYRTPFLDDKVIALTRQIPVSWKIHQTAPARFVEKYILREAFRDILPDVIYRRVKLRFAAGTGTDGLMDEIARHQVSREEFMAHGPTAAGYKLHSPKELWYYRIFREQYPAPSYEALVGRWDPFK